MERCPSINVPVTTVPNPLMVKTRSIGKRGRPKSGRAGFCLRISLRVVTSWSSPLRVRAETRTIGASCRTVFFTAARTSDSIKSIQSLSWIKSILVITINPDGICRRSRIAICSRVCGMMPSSAAMTSSAASIPPTPASMFSIKSRCPGTSTMPTSSPMPCELSGSGNVSQPKPRSMVISRSCSSFNRSGCVPVSAAIRVDLP